MAKLSEIEGIGDVNAEKLQACGVTTQEQLLEQGGSPAGRIQAQLCVKMGSRAA